MGKWTFIIAAIAIALLFIQYLTKLHGGDDMYSLGFAVLHMPLYCAVIAYSIGFGVYEKCLKYTLDDMS